MSPDELIAELRKLSPEVRKRPIRMQITEPYDDDAATLLEHICKVVETEDEVHLT